MKKASLLISALLISMSSMAQMYLWQDGQSTSANLDSITFSANAKYDNTFTIAPSMMGLQVGKTAQLKLVDNTLPVNAYQWKSSNRGVATVDTKGVVTAKASGMAIISAISGLSEQTCILTVYGATDVQSINMPATLSAELGAEPFQMPYEVVPENTTATIEWTSSDPAVAKVDAKGVVTLLALGTTNIIASVGNIRAVCVLTVNNDAALNDFGFVDYGLFGTLKLIEGSNKKYLTVGGNNVLCQGGYITFAAWSDGLTYTSGKGFSGNGYMIFTDMPVWVIIEGTYKGKFIEPDNGCYWVDTCSNIRAYTAKAGELVNLQNYGDFFKQVIAKNAGIIDNVDGKLYNSSQIGTQIFQYNADENTQTYNLGNIMEAGFKKDNGKFLYAANIEWYDFVNADRWLGLKANFDANGNLVSLIELYDMRTIKKGYTNVETNNSAPAKVQSQFKKLQAEEDNEPQYTLADPAHIHLGENPFPADVKRVVKK